MGQKVDKWGEVGDSGAHVQEWTWRTSRHGRETERAQVFLGEFIHTLDSKGRVVLPRSFRDALEDGLVTTKGKDGNVVVFPAGTFEELARSELEKERTRDARRKARSMFSGADLMHLDGQGRILLKPELQQYAGIEGSKDVAVVGLFDRIEIWDVGAFEAERDAADSDYRANEEEPGF